MDEEKTLQRIFEFAHDSKFQFGDIIRHKSPYIGEPKYKIENMDQYGYSCSVSPEYNEYRHHTMFDEAEFYVKQDNP